MTDKELEKIYNEAYKAVYWTAMSLLKNENDAEDVVQDTFVTLIESYETIEDKNKVTAWLKKIAANKCLNRLTRTKTDSVEDEFFEDVEAVPEDFLPDSIVESAEMRKIIMDIIERSLSKDIRRTLILFYFDEMSTKEIAETLGVPEGTVRRRLNFARNKIKKEVGKYEEENKTKLFGMAALPFLSKLFIEEAAQVPFKAMPASLISTLSASAKASTHGAATKSAVSAAKKGTGIVMKKVVIGSIAAVVAVGAVVGVIIYLTNRQPDIEPAETNVEVQVSETDASLNEDVTSGSATDTTTETTETTDITEAAYEISESEYLADYPVPGNGIMVYFKLAPEIDFYPDAKEPSLGYTYGDYYNSSINSDAGLAEVVCMVDEGSNAKVIFTCNPAYTIDDYIENADVGIFGDGSFTHTISEPEILENGFKIYTVETDFGLETTTQYFIEYQIDENNLFRIYTTGFNEAFSDPVYQTELESILNYYRTVENPILVVDKDTPVVIVN